MSEHKFISLNEYTSKKNLVNETMILEKGDEDGNGIFGKIIDRGLSFVPRAMRFKKAKKTMKRSLGKYIKKSKKVINKFAKSFQTKVATIDPEYKKLKKEVDKFAAEGKDMEAKSAMEVHLKELETYKKEQMDILDKGIQDIFNAYTNAIDQRIDTPGFVFNVELSEKGKGELKAKWQEFGAIAKMKIDEHKTILIKSKGWKRIDEIIAEIKAFVESRRYARELKDADFFVEHIGQSDLGFAIKILFRISGARFKVVEKGFLIHQDDNELTLEGAAVVKKFTGTNRYQLGGWKDYISGNTPLDYYIRPYCIVKEIVNPIYGSHITIRNGMTGGKNLDNESKRDLRNETEIT